MTIKKIVICDKCGKEGSCEISRYALIFSIITFTASYDIDSYPKDFHHVEDKDLCGDCFKGLKLRIRGYFNK